MIGNNPEDAPECTCGGWEPKTATRALEEHDEHVAVAMSANLPVPGVTNEAIDYLGRWRWERYDTEIPHQHAQSVAFARQFLEGLIPLLSSPTGN